MARSILLLAYMCVACAAWAAPVRMTGTDILRVMQPGAVLEIDTPLRISIPVKVNSDRIVSADAGALGLTLGAQKDRGRWWTEGDMLCMKWFRWFDAKPRCINLRRDGNRVYWHETSGESGTATLTEAQPAEKPVVVAKAEPVKVEPVKAEPKPAAVADLKPSIATDAEAKPVIAAEAKPATASEPKPQIEIAAQQAVEVQANPASSAPDATRYEPPAIQIVAASTTDGDPSSPFASPAFGEAIVSKAVEPTQISMLGGPVADAPAAEQAPAAERAPIVEQVPAAHETPAATRADAPGPLVMTERDDRSVDAGALKSRDVSKVLYQVTRVRSDDALTMRSGPSEYHTAVGAISAAGRNIEIIGECSDAWCPVRHGTEVGWVNSHYLRVDGDTREASARQD